MLVSLTWLLTFVHLIEDGRNPQVQCSKCKLWQRAHLHHACKRKTMPSKKKQPVKKLKRTGQPLPKVAARTKVLGFLDSSYFPRTPEVCNIDGTSIHSIQPISIDAKEACLAEKAHKAERTCLTAEALHHEVGSLGLPDLSASFPRIFNCFHLALLMFLQFKQEKVCILHCVKC